MKNKRTRVITWILVILILLGVVFLILEKSNIINFAGKTNTAQDAAKEQQKADKAAADSKASYLDQAYGNNGTISQPTNTSPSPVTPSASPSSLALSATQDGDNVTITTKIQNVSEGTCKLSITNGADTITRQAAIIYQPEFSSCAGFSIAKSSLGVGSWSVAVSVVPTAGETVTKTVNLEVQ